MTAIRLVPVLLLLLCFVGCAQPSGDGAEEGFQVEAGEFPSTQLPSTQLPSVETRRYRGQGAVFSPAGEALGEYTIDLTREPSGTGYVHHITVHLPDGNTMQMTQAIGAEEGRVFQIDSPDGAGGGLDLGDGLLTTCTTRADGTAQVSTIALDGDDGMRIVRYDLRDGEATKIFRERYTRI